MTAGRSCSSAARAISAGALGGGAPAPSKQEVTYEALRKRIVSGVYRPGHRLVIESIAREFGVSAMPAREAVRRLEAEGWVVYRRNQGAEVSAVDGLVWGEAMQVLALLDGHATALTAPRLDASGFAELRGANGEMQKGIEAFDVRRIAQANRAFHQIIYDRCPNDHLRRQLAAVQERVDSYRAAILPYIVARPPVSLQEHATLIDMMERGASAIEIELFAREHKLRTVQTYLAQEVESSTYER